MSGKGKEYSFLLPLYFMLLGVIIVLSGALLIMGLKASGENTLDATIYTTLGVAGFFFAFYSIQEARKRMKLLQKKKGRIMTVIKCNKCNHVYEREFKEGDYVYKNAGDCPKCGGDSFIFLVYAFREDKKGIT